MTMRVRKAVFPAAGLGTRFLSLSYCCCAGTRNLDNNDYTSMWN